MTTGLHILTEGDDANDLAGSNVISLTRPAREPTLLGDIVAAFVLPELAIRMRGDFDLPRLAVRADREDSRP